MKPKIALDRCTERAKGFEGFKKKVYKCSAGKLTIGYGRNLEDKGVNQQEAEGMLVMDIFDAMCDLDSIFHKAAFWPDKVLLVLTDMMFNLGKTRFLGFKKMIAAIEKQDWATAADEAKDSKWFKQVGKRGLDNVRLLREAANDQS
jgi:lysozyme